MMKAHILGHVGKLNIKTGELNFYGLQCPNVFKAFEFLRDLNPQHNYRMWMYRGKKGLKNVDDGWVYIRGQWLPDEAMARDYIKNRYTLQENVI